MKGSPSTLPPGKERLERAIAHQGFASRREAKDLIRSGGVRVNGTVIREPGYGIDMDKDRIELEEESMGRKETILFYKPRGIETNATSPGAKDIHSALVQYKHLSPIGRLDKESEGLIILSNDGSLAAILTKEDSTIGKTYLVSTREPVSDSDLTRMATGIMLDGVPTKPAKTNRASRSSFTIVLYEGRKHQIRRMCDACHLTITSLTRTQIGSIGVGRLKSGSSRRLSAEEIASLRK